MGTDKKIYIAIITYIVKGHVFKGVLYTPLISMAIRSTMKKLQ